MASDRLVKQSDALLKRLDRRSGIGFAATYTIKTASSTDAVTGVVTYTTTVSDVKVRSSPLTVSELKELSDAGVKDVETRWLMRHAYQSSVAAGHELTIAGSKYVVIDATLDGLSNDWTIYTRRMR